MQVLLTSTALYSDMHAIANIFAWRLQQDNPVHAWIPQNRPLSQQCGTKRSQTFTCCSKITRDEVLVITVTCQRKHGFSVWICERVFRWLTFTLSMWRASVVSPPLPTTPTPPPLSLGGGGGVPRDCKFPTFPMCSSIHVYISLFLLVWTDN